MPALLGLVATCLKLMPPLILPTVPLILPTVPLLLATVPLLLPFLTLALGLLTPCLLDCLPVGIRLLLVRGVDGVQEVCRFALLLLCVDGGEAGKESPACRGEQTRREQNKRQGWCMQRGWAVATSLAYSIAFSLACRLSRADVWGLHSSSWGVPEG